MSVDWYQDDTTVSIVLYEAAVQPSSLRVVWSTNVLTISYVTNKGDESSDVPGGSPNAMSQSLELHLSSSIMDPTSPGSGYKLLCSKKKVEMQFRKATSGRWATLEVPKIPMHPTISSYSKFVRLLQDIYAKGDENTKRAMMKSFVGRLMVPYCPQTGTK
ncbi:hypothetical protein X943_000135 [Babesia divergens]|uniref:CS domain-containing protein n=1 Tax=Babesia divergens TaxID=32595 RepID=A0AAD9GGS0_BABDI|nr:hypothetical protein X943_000135 [Babesia divergens]